VTVTVDGESLTVADVVAVAREGEPVALADHARAAVRASRERVADLLTTDGGLRHRHRLRRPRD
jgi:histidine ammonia-lyase